jgi:hypothetical protein
LAAHRSRSGAPGEGFGSALLSHILDVCDGQNVLAYLEATSPVKKEPNPKVVDDNIWIPYQKITKENYKSFMK